VRGITSTSLIFCLRSPRKTTIFRVSRGTRGAREEKPESAAPETSCANIYDDLHRLKQAWRFSGLGGPGYWEMRYDLLNRVTFRSDVGVYGYPSDVNPYALGGVTWDADLAAARLSDGTQMEHDVEGCGRAAGLLRP
jgi:hypothetical protein